MVSRRIRENKRWLWGAFLFVAIFIFSSWLGGSQAAAEVVDLLPFFCPACVGEGTNQRNLVGGECFYTYPSDVKGRSGFYIVKSCGDMTVFEEFAYDGNNIYHLADTSWATYDGSNWTAAKCYDGRIAYSTYLNGNFGSPNGSCNDFNPNMGNEGNIWVPRYLDVGQQPEGLPTTIVAFAKDSCTCCEAQYTGPTGRWVKLVSKEPMDLGNGLGVKDVVRIAIMEGPGKGENFWYARNYGWVAFGHVDPPDGDKSFYDVTRIHGVDNNGHQRQATCGGTPPPPPPPGNCISGVPENRWKGEYFDNENLSGSPKMVKDDGDGSINYDWGMGGPSACGIGTDYFSVRWTKKFPPGIYNFTMAVDDGGRLWVNDNKVIDAWKTQPPTAYTAGPFTITGIPVIFEYFEHNVGATAKLTWEKVGDVPQPPPSTPFTGSTGWEDGQPQGDVDDVMYSQSVGPHPGGAKPECSRRAGETVRTGSYALLVAGSSQADYAYCYYRLFDNLSIPVTGQTKIGYYIYHSSGTPQVAVDGYFTDGSIIRNSGLLDQNQVNIHPAARNDAMNQWVYVEVNLAPVAGKTLKTLMFAFDNGGNKYKGPYRAYVDDLRVFEGGGGGSCSANVPENRWKGEYFSNQDLSGLPSMVKDDGDGPLNMQGGTDSPGSGCGIPTDHFSVRWTKAQNFAPGLYTFTMSVDDGGRFYIDGDKKIDVWKDQAEAAYTTGQITLSGDHTLKMEYYENAGLATAKLSWEKVGEIPPPPPSQALETGFEDGQNLGFQNRFEYAKDIGEKYCFRPTPGQMPHTGNYSYIVAGVSQGSYAYAYCRAFDTNLPIQSGTKIGYWINLNQGSPKIAVDGKFTTGETIRDFRDGNNQPLKDQNQIPIHPTAREPYRNQMGQYIYVEVDLSPAAGKTLEYVMFAFDNGGDGFTGVYRAYVDDFRIGVFSTPPPPPPPPTTGKSKLSVQTSFAGGGPLTKAFVQQARPKVVKIIDDMGQVPVIKQLAPDTIIIGRLFIDDGLFGVGDGNPEQKAQDWYNMVKGRMIGGVDYWEGTNERAVPGKWAVEWYARFEKKRVELMAADGRKACIGTFSVGVPDITDPTIWPAFYPAIDAAMAHGGALCLHEYSAPTMKYGFNESTEFSNGLQPGEGWFTGRYRMVYHKHLIPDGRVIPLFITECGVDGGINGSAPSKPGWKVYYDDCQYRDAQNNPIKSKCYFDDLVWYDNMLKQDDYVIGATIFSLELPNWDNFDIAGDVLDMLTAYVKDGSTPPTEPTPPPQPPPTASAFSSGWEDAQRDGQPGVEMYRKDVIGYSNTSGSLPEAKRQSGEQAHDGSFALKVSGTSKANYAYSYHKIYENLNLTITSGMKLTYYIYHAEGSGQIAIDGIFKSNETFRDLGGHALKDQNSVPIHPALRKDPIGQWYYVEVDLTQAVGKVLDVLMVAFDNGNIGYQGRYLAYVDDLNIAVGSITPPPVEPPSDIVWDSRLDGLNIKLEQAAVSSGQTYCRLVKALLHVPEEPFDPTLPGGDHHIYIEIVDEQGTRMVGQKAVVQNGGTTYLTIENKPYPEYGCNYGMYGMLGSYSAWADGLPSDKVTGMGLPMKQHVTFYLTFQRAVK